MLDVVVIGGGASGLVASIYAAKNKNRVVLLEKNNVCGKKILITGSGKCNYWNEDQNLNHYHTNHPEILKNIVTEIHQEEILLFFNKIGIIPKIKDGYYYPISGQATSIQTALIKEASVQGVEIKNNIEVFSIEKEKNYFKICTNEKEYLSKKVILSTGSKAYPKTGSDGLGYTLASSFGHSITPVLPALVQLKAHENYLKEWHGIRSDVKITLFENDKMIQSEVGEIQLTDYGISGICVFCLSGRVAKGLLQKKKEQVQINFLYPFSIDEEKTFASWMNERNEMMEGRSVSDLLDGILNYKLINLILKLTHIKRDSFWKDLSLKEQYQLGIFLTKFKITITGTNSFDSSQTCTGGIPLTEINSDTMESLKMKDLYFTGELLDVDGDCGGYNLGFAWITGMIAGKNCKGEKYD